MKVFIRTPWSGNYEEITTTELQYRIDHYVATDFMIDEIADECIYVTQIERE